MLGSGGLVQPPHTYTLILMEYARECGIFRAKCGGGAGCHYTSLHHQPSCAKLHWTLGARLGARLGAAAGRITKLQRAIRPSESLQHQHLQAHLLSSHF